MGEVEQIEKRRDRRPNARNSQIIMGALEENARMLLRDPHSEGIGARISELLEELSRALNGKGKDDGK